MTSTSSRSLRRRAAWTVPVVTAAVVTAATVLPSAASANAHPNLPARTAAQLLAGVQKSTVSTLSGTIVETARLGLPSLPGSDSSAALSVQTLVTGTHSARVWFDGPERQRLALLGQLAESDVVHNGRDMWTYASDSQQAAHTVLPAEKADKANTSAKAHDLTTYTPQGAADQALKAIDPSTVVTVDRTARVAGRPAYTLVLTPRDTRSTVRKVLIAIDARRSIPLRVQVFADGKAPAFETAFTNISYAKPAASVFRFIAPHGARVSSDLLGTSAPHERSDAKKSGTAKPSAGASPKVLGSGWTAVVEVPAAADGSSPLSSLTGGGNNRDDSAASLLGRLTTTLPNGDKVLHSALLNVLLAKDGRTFVGAVSPELLEQAAAGHLG